MDYTFNDLALGIDAINNIFKLEQVSGTTKLRLAQHLNALIEGFKDYDTARKKAGELIQAALTKAIDGETDEQKQTRVSSIQKKEEADLVAMLSNRNDFTLTVKPLASDVLIKDTGNKIGGNDLATLVRIGLVEAVDE